MIRNCSGGPNVLTKVLESDRWRQDRQRRRRDGEAVIGTMRYSGFDNGRGGAKECGRPPEMERQAMHPLLETLQKTQPSDTAI